MRQWTPSTPHKTSINRLPWNSNLECNQSLLRPQNSNTTSRALQASSPSPSVATQTPHRAHQQPDEQHAHPPVHCFLLSSKKFRRRDNNFSLYIIANIVVL